MQIETKTKTKKQDGQDDHFFLSLKLQDGTQSTWSKRAHFLLKNQKKKRRGGLTLINEQSERERKGEREIPFH